MSFGPLDTGSGIPLYVQIESRLRMAIAQGVWTVGDLLPTEEEMSRVFGVSRGTIRQALDRMVRDRIILRERRRGTRVIKGTASDGLILVTPFGAIEAAGMKATVNVLTLAEIRTPDFIARRWTPRHEWSVRFERVFLADGRPVAYGDSYLPSDRFRELLDMDVTDMALLEVLQRHFEVVITRLDQTSELVPIPNKQAELLGLPRGVVAYHAVLCQWMGDLPVEYAEFWLPRDKSRFLIAGLYAFGEAGVRR